MTLRNLTTVAASCVLAVSLSACTGFPGVGGGGDVAGTITKDLQTCHREYNGSLGPVPAATFKIICEPTVPTLAPGAVVAPTGAPPVPPSAPMPT